MTSTGKIRLLIVDDHPVVREGLRSMLSRSPGIEIVAVCSSGQAALKIAEKQPLDVMLIDMRMTPMNGIDVLRALGRVAPHCKGLILSSYQLEEEIYQAAVAGAAGYLCKDALPAQILDQIALAHTGKNLFPAYLLARFEARKKKRNLTPRELQILNMVAKGLTNKEIAHVLNVSQFTVRNQISSFSAKLEVSDRTEAARVAIEQGIILL